MFSVLRNDRTVRNRAIQIIPQQPSPLQNANTRVKFLEDPRKKEGMVALKLNILVIKLLLILYRFLVCRAFFIPHRSPGWTPGASSSNPPW